MKGYDPLDPRDLIVEVCCICGRQLDRYNIRRDGRCVDPSHHASGGMVLRVQARPLSEQDGVVELRAGYGDLAAHLWPEERVVSEQRAILVSREQRDAVTVDAPVVLVDLVAAFDAAGDQTRIRWCAKHEMPVEVGDFCPWGACHFPRVCRVVDAIVCCLESVDG